MSSKRRRAAYVDSGQASVLPLLLNITQVAQLLGVSRTTAHRLLDSGQLKYRRVGADRRVPRAELFDFANRDLVGAK